MRNLKVKNESLSLFTSIIIAFLFTILILNISIELMFFLLIVQLFYIVFLQKQIQGNAIKTSVQQYGRVYQIVVDLSRELNIKTPESYISYDPYINAYVMGYKNPYTLVLTSALVESLTEKELQFVIGHELGHIKFNHSRLKSLVAPLDRNIPIITLIFNSWLRKTEYTADRVGLYLTKDINAATNALLKLSIGSKLSQEINIHEYINQIKGSFDEHTEKIGELLLSHPYNTNRILSLVELNSIIYSVVK